MTNLSIKMVILSILLLSGCKNQSAEPHIHQTEEFKNYWYAGKGEVNSYNLNQSRYGESRAGKAMLIFVTEDLSRRKQVKLDDPAKARDKISTLKMNYTKNFNTGIYPYSMMLSVFTPVARHEYPYSLKAVMSAQEWCGQVFTQLNQRGRRYGVKSYSYFEKEKDQVFSVPRVLLEDELWNIIRLNHQDLPTGNVDVIPGLFFTRLNHVPLKMQQATAEKQEKTSTFLYTISFLKLERTLAIEFEKTFPYKILNWKETWKQSDKLLETTGELSKTMHVDYWTKNGNEFLYLRDSLGVGNNY